MANSNEFPYRELRPHLPPTWSNLNHNSNLNTVPLNSVEYNEVMKNFSADETKLLRHQNVNQYGMFLIRQQHLQVIHPNVNFVKVSTPNTNMHHLIISNISISYLFQVTRYCRLQRSTIEEAVEFNLDERRLEEPVIFTISPPNVLYNGDIVLVVSFITEESNFGTSNLQPKRDCDFYIEYCLSF